MATGRRGIKTAENVSFFFLLNDDNDVASGPQQSARINSSLRMRQREEGTTNRTQEIPKMRGEVSDFKIKEGLIIHSGLMLHSCGPRSRTKAFEACRKKKKNLDLICGLTLT